MARRADRLLRLMDQTLGGGGGGAGVSTRGLARSALLPTRRLGTLSSVAASVMSFLPRQLRRTSQAAAAPAATDSLPPVSAPAARAPVPSAGRRPSRQRAAGTEPADDVVGYIRAHLPKGGEVEAGDPPKITHKVQPGENVRETQST